MLFPQNLGIDQYMIKGQWNGSISNQPDEEFNELVANSSWSEPRDV